MNGMNGMDGMNELDGMDNFLVIVLAFLYIKYNFQKCYY